MRHLAALGRFALAGVFVLTQSTWGADSDSDWRTDKAIVAAQATDNTYIKKFIANAYAKYPTAADWKKTKPGYSGFKKDLKDLIDKSDPDNEADPTFITLLGKLKTKYGVKMKLPKVDPADGQEAAVDKCAGKGCADQAQPVSKKTKATAQSIKDAAEGAAGQDGDEGKQGGGGRADPPPKREHVADEPPAEPVIPAAPEPVVPVVNAGASIQSNGGGGIGGLFGGGGSFMPFLGGALVGGILGSIMQRNGGGLGGLFGGSGGGQFGGAPYGYPQYNMMGLGRGPILPGRYQAPGAGVGIGGFGATGGGYGSFGGGGYGAPAFAPYVSNGGIYGGGAVQNGGYFSSPAFYGGATGGGALCTNCVLPSLYPAGAYVPGVH